MIHNADTIEQITDLLTIHKEFMEPFGELATYFNTLDKILTESIVGFIAPMVGGPIERTNNCRLALGEINSFAVRQRILQRIVNSLPEGGEREEYFEILNWLEEANKSRNKILHADWSSYWPVKQVLSAETKKEPVDYSADDIRYHTSVIRYAVLRLGWADLKRYRVFHGEPIPSLDRPFQPPQR